MELAQVKDIRFQMRIDKTFEDLVNNWRKKQEKPLSMAEAMRLLVRAGESVLGDHPHVLCMSSTPEEYHVEKEDFE
jgi:hypothetical protein